MPKYVRARAGIPALLHPESGVLVSPSPDVPVLESDPLVKKFRWAFQSDDEIAEEIEAAKDEPRAVVESVTAAPGEKRSTRRAKK